MAATVSMFAGLVDTIGDAVLDIRSKMLYVYIPNDTFWNAFWASIERSNMIAINGVPLAIFGTADDSIAKFQLSDEILATTNLNNTRLADECSHPSEIKSALILNHQSEYVYNVNVEKSLVLDSSNLHFIEGRVDLIGTIRYVFSDGDGNLIVDVVVSNSAMPEMGSLVSLDGMLLTVVDTDSARSFFTVKITQTTQTRTTLSDLVVGLPLNVEFKKLPKNIAQRAKWDVITASDMSVDKEMMKLAIQAGLLGRFTAAPNPAVGCVIIRTNGQILGTGHHEKAGTPHAEIKAIQAVVEEYGQERAEMLMQGSTCYVTLEPCSHFGRTGPCDMQLIKYKVARVVVGCVDPDTRVSGTGVAHLREAGIKVVTGVLEQECAKSMEAYLKHRKTGKPLVVVKIATSLDGKIGFVGDSKAWISNIESRQHSHETLRAASQAILIGSSTAVIDNPSLKVVHWPTHVKPDYIQQPLRVVVGRNVVLGSNLLDTTDSKTLVITTDDPSNIERCKQWQSNGIQVVQTNELTDNHISFDFVLRHLASLGILQVLVESGSSLASSLLTEGHVDKLVVYQAPIMLGSNGISWTNDLKVQSTNDAHAGTTIDNAKLVLQSVQKIGNDVCCEYDVCRPEK